MIIVFRVDSAQCMGYGHVMRCLALASELQNQKANIYFICKDLPGNIAGIIKKQFPVFSFEYEQDSQAIDYAPDAENTKEILLREKIKPDWLVVDHYQLDITWESQMKKVAKKIMVIDDLANRRHACDVLVDQNVYEQMESRYCGLVDCSCKTLLGPEYALLRHEFSVLRKTLSAKNRPPKRIFISFGGSDSTNETEKAIDAVLALPWKDVTVDVVVGGAHAHATVIEKKCKQAMNVNFYLQTNKVAEIMAYADLALGAGGITIWERCSLGLPALVTVAAENQLETVRCLAKRNIIINMGWAHSLTSQHYLEAILRLSTEKLTDLRRNSAKLVDGAGCTRVATAMLAI